MNINTSKSLSERTAQFFESIAEQGLEQREGQVEMALEICKAIEERKPIASEAEVGIGKSYAYLIPAVMLYDKEHSQIVIATSTIALQEQLANDAQEVVKMTGIKVPITVAKGMRNYSCERRLQNAVITSKGKDRAVFNKLRSYTNKGIQQRSDFDMAISDDIWNRICVTRFSQKCEHCDHNCKYKALRNTLSRSNGIVICNQNLLAAHLKNLQETGKGIFNTNCCMTIVDEAHNLEPKFRDIFTQSCTRNDFLWGINAAVESASKNRKSDAKKYGKLASELIEQLYEILLRHVKEQRHRRDGDNTAYYFNNTKEVQTVIRAAIKRLEQLERITHCVLDEDKRFLKGILNVSDRNILWLEKDRQLKICLCKKDIRFYISQMLFPFCHTTVLTSATISDKTTGTAREKCGYFLDGLGFPVIGHVSEPKASPFDYDSNAMLYISNKLPYPNLSNRKIYREQSIEEILRLLSVTHGKTLILFTSKEDMQFVYKKLVNLPLPYRIIVQGQSSSQAHKLDRFRDETDSVLLGTGTYWEGINIEGESLSQVIIFKLPFPVPDPIIDYKMSKAEDRVRDVAVPEMIIKLKQGAGRLIRSSSDKGIVSILDPRASIKENKPYRETILNALCEKNSTEDMDELTAFWNRLNGEKEAV